MGICSAKSKSKYNPQSPNQSLSKNFGDFLALLNEKKPEIIDVKADATKGFVKNSFCLNTFFLSNLEKFKVCFPCIVPLDKPLIFVIEPTFTAEVLKSFVDFGYTNILGYLEGGFDSWVKHKGETTVISTIEPQDLKQLMEEKGKNIVLFDIRSQQECDDKGIYEPAQFRTLKDLGHDISSGSLDQLKQSSDIYLFCQMGAYRSELAVSLLLKNRFHKVAFIIGGIKKMEEVGFEIKKMKV